MQLTSEADRQVRAASATQVQCGTVVERQWLSHLTRPDGCLYCRLIHSCVYTLAGNDTAGDNSHFTMSDVDTMPCILALIMSCFSCFEIVYVTGKILLQQKSGFLLRTGDRLNTFGLEFG